VRQFIFSSDVARFLIYAIENISSVPFSNVILSPDASEEISIRTLSCMIAEQMKVADVIFNTHFTDGQMRKTCDNNCFRRHFPDFKFTSLKDGLMATIEWFNNHYNDARK